uniref:Tc1-like transposase DDE domain-containing protein n=1 Tax=Astatotilapia calliptera TaxID=8154 RepID=A0A3P8QXB4_ASTCA
FFNLILQSYNLRKEEDVAHGILSENLTKKWRNILWTESLDLNPTENLWGGIKNAVSEAKPRNAEELWKAVKSSWAGIPVYTCQKLVDSVQHRCEAVLKNSGYTTKY